MAIQTYKARMADLKIPLQVARRLRRDGCKTLRFLMITVHRLLALRAKEPLTQANAKKLLNNTLGSDYVLIASSFDGILSDESAIRDAVEDLHLMLRSDLAYAQTSMGRI